MRNKFEFKPVLSEEYLLKQKSEQIIDDLLDRTRAGLANTDDQLASRRLQEQVYPAGLSLYTLEDFGDIDVSPRAIEEVNHIWQRMRPAPKNEHIVSRSDEQLVTNRGMLHSIEWPIDSKHSRPTDQDALREQESRDHESIIREVGKAAMVAAGGEARPIVAVIDANVVTQSPEHTQEMADFFRARATDLRKLDKGDGMLWVRKMILIKNPRFPEATREAQNALLDFFRQVIKEDDWLAADAFPAGVSREEAYPTEAITDDRPIIAPAIKFGIESDTRVYTSSNESKLNKAKH